VLKPWIMDRDYQLWILLSDTRDAIWWVREKDLAPYNISAIQGTIFYVLESMNENEATPSEISRRVSRKHHTVSELLNRMEKAGLVKTTRVKNKKKVTVSMTDKGRDIYDQSKKRQSIHKIVSSLSEEEYQQTVKCLRKLKDAALNTTSLNT
jgi:DNA-binding MarR family transcriptional regulator